MIADFISSWDFFSESYLLGLSLAALLPLLGSIVVLRRQLFITMAISQSSFLGLSVAIWLQFNAAFTFFQEEHAQPYVVILFSFLASLLCFRTFRSGEDSRETATVVIFIMATVCAFLVLSQTPVGLKELQERMSSSLISTSLSEFFLTLLLLFSLAIFWKLKYRSIILICADPIAAKATGKNLFRWELIFSLIIGVILGWAIYLSGYLHSFGCLLFPVFIAKKYTHSISQCLWLSSILSVILSLIAYTIALPLNIPFSQMSTALMGIIYILLVLISIKK